MAGYLLTGSVESAANESGILDNRLSDSFAAARSGASNTP